MHEHRMGAKVIKSAYPEKIWSLITLKAMCRRIDATGSAVDRQADSGRGRPKSVRTAANVAKVGELIASQEDQPGTSKSTRHIAKELIDSQQKFG